MNVDERWDLVPNELRNQIIEDYAKYSQGTTVSDIAKSELLYEYFGENITPHKFRVGDFVTIKGTLVKREIVRVGKRQKVYQLKGKGGIFGEEELEEWIEEPAPNCKYTDCKQCPLHSSCKYYEKVVKVLDEQINNF